MSSVQRISPCFWFDGVAVEAAQFYTSIFPNSKLGDISLYSEAGQELHGKEPGTPMAVAFELDGQSFTGINGGPMFQFTEAISFQVNCDTQAETDHYWDQLSAGGDPAAQQCGWLKDKFGVSWQIVPSILPKLLNVPDIEKSQKVMQALLQMKKLDIADLERAAE